MTLSTNMETQISSNIAKFGNTVWLINETQSFNTYNETHPASWTEASSTSTIALIVPFNPRTANGEEFHYLTQGVIQEDDLVGFIDATQTVEQTNWSASASRYVIEHNAVEYDIVKIFPIEFQDNVVFKKMILRRITT